MKNSKLQFKNKKFLQIAKQFSIYFAFYILCSAFFLTSCGYRMVGSTSLPFHSITIKHVLNKTYEPRLEDVLHNAISKEFLAQGIEVLPARPSSSAPESFQDIGVVLETVITIFHLSTIAASDEKVKEQAVTMYVDFRVIDRGRIMEFKAVKSPINVTFQTAGTVAESVVEKERAIEKACSEIAKEIVSKIIIRYAK